MQELSNLLIPLFIGQLTMITLEAFSELLLTLYSAPLDQQQWQKFLLLVTAHTQSKYGIFLSADVRNGLLALAVSHPDFAAAAAKYNQQFAQSDPFRHPAIKMGKVGVYTDEQLLPNNGITRTPLYIDIMKDYDARYATCTLLNLSMREFDGLSIWRSHSSGPMPAESLHMISLLVPHIQLALKIYRTLGVTDQKLAGAELMADASSTATFLLTAQGRIEHLNAAAETLLRSNDGLALLNNQLTATEANAKPDFAHLLQTVAAHKFTFSVDQSYRALSLPRPSGKQPLQLLACPTPLSHRQRTNADILLLVTDPDHATNFPDDVLRSLYNFTHSEAEIANGLLMTYTTEEIALLRRVSIGTVRQQIKTMLHKTATTRQSEMMRLLMALPKPHLK